jgi:hypothetical protein
MRPQDVVILLKIIALKNNSWQYRSLSTSLNISISEISESLNRSALAGLIINKKVARNAFFEFLNYGLPYVFPQKPGEIVTGIPTAHSHPFYEQKIISEYPYVWPCYEGTVRGQAIEPLHKGLVVNAAQDDDFYLLLASIDIIRVGKTREIHLAKEILSNCIL